MLPTCKEGTEEEDEIQERIRNVGHSSKFHVIDGGYLLQRVIWDKFSTYNEIIQKQVNQSRYGKCVAVFNRDRDRPSTKNHGRCRLMKVVISPDVCVTLESEFTSTSQKVFLSNTRNKQCFIDLLADNLNSNGRTVWQSVGDVHVDIVSSVLVIACEGKHVTLVGADTDLLILILYMWIDSMGSMTMKCEGAKKYSQITCNIGDVAKFLTQIKYLTHSEFVTPLLPPMDLVKLLSSRQLRRK